VPFGKERSRSLESRTRQQAATFTYYKADQE
jgi:hypothetical protein